MGHGQKSAKTFDSYLAPPSRLKYVVSQIKREKKIEKSTTHYSQQFNLLNNQQLYKPRTCPFISVLISMCFKVSLGQKSQSSGLQGGKNLNFHDYYLSSRSTRTNKPGIYIQVNYLC